METLTEDDLDWLTRVENRLITMRKRETAHRNLLVRDITDTIKEMHGLREMLSARFGKTFSESV
jgi:hypothetical protein